MEDEKKDIKLSENNQESQQIIELPKDIETNVTNIESLKEEFKQIEDYKPKILYEEEKKIEAKKEIFPNGKIYVIGHRGLSYEPENTLKAINKAIEFGVDAVEIDVHLSKDGEPIVIHDDTLERTTNGFGRVDQTNYRGLKNLDAGKGEKIPTLQEAINACREKTKLIIELKSDRTEKTVANAIRRNHFYNDCYCISFWHNIIKKIKRIDNKINTGILFVGHPVRAWRLAKDADADMLFINYKFISKKLVEQCHKNRIKVFVWNVDHKDELQKYIDLGVNGICSNKPDIVIDHINKLEND